MVPPTRRYIGLVAIFLFSLPAWAAPWKLTPQEARKLMPVQEIRPGMRGIGKTVFRGTKIESFDFTVIGILREYYMGGDMILIKMHGGPITQRHANIIAGMSGSPCYIKGRLIGAVSMGDFWAKESFAIVTPIYDMLRAFDTRLNSIQPVKMAEVPPQSYCITIDGRPTTVRMEPGYQTKQEPSPPGVLTMRRLATPVMVGGLSRRVREWLEKQWEPYGLTFVDGLADAGGSVFASSKEAATLMQPGAAVSCLLMTGDMRAGATGTLTYRSGNKILAFGHPMVEFGSVDFLLGTAIVHDIFPSIQRSYKQSSIGKLTGAIFQDSSWAIAGDLSRRPKLIPVTCTVSDITTGRNRVYRAQVVDHPLLTGGLILSAVGEAIFRTHNFIGDATARVRMEVSAEGFSPIIRENVYFSPDLIDLISVEDLSQCLNILRSNPFHPVRIKAVNMSVQLANRHQSASIEKIFVDKDKVEPGEKIQIGVVLKPYGRDPITKTIEQTIPERIPNGRATLMVRGGGLSGVSSPGVVVITTASPGGQPGAPSAPVPTGPVAANVKQMVQRFLEKEKNNELAVRLMLPTYSVNVEGEKMTDLPASVVQVMRSGKSTGLRQERDEVKWNIPTDWVLTGAQSIQVTIQKRDRSEKKGQPRPEAPSPGGPVSPPPPMPVSIDVEDWDSIAAPVEVGASPVLDGAMAAAAPKKPLPSKESKEKPEGPATPPAEQPAPQPAERPGKPVGKAPKLWKQSTQADFENDILQKVRTTSENDVRLAPSVELFADLPEDYVWCLLPDGSGGLYAGTGNQGRIYHIAPDGKAAVLYDSEDLEVFCLAKDAQGNLYAGTAPNGVVYRITPDGRASVFYKAPSRYVLALNVDAGGTVYVATGGKEGNLYKVSPDGKGALWYASPEMHVLCLTRDQQGNLLAGTGDNGIIYRITPEGKASVVYDAVETAVTSLMVDAKGNIYAGTSPKGVIYRIAPDGSVKTLYDKAKAAIQTLSIDSQGVLYAGSASDIFRLEGRDIISSLDTPENLQVVSLAVGADHQVYIGTANHGAIYRAVPSREGVLESCVHDARLAARWGRLSWIADVPEGARIRFETRTGDTAEPDSSWSPWQGVPAQSTDGRIVSPPGRFIQYRALLHADDPAKTPVLKQVTLGYVTRNQAPTVAFTSPAGGEKWSKTQTVRWNGADPDSDTLSYELFYSGDEGQTWKPLRSEPKPAPAPPGGSPPAVSASQEDAKETPAREDTPKKEEQTPPKDGKATPPKPAPELALKETSFSWDTTRVPDGAYRLKIVASDRLSDLADPQRAEKISERVLICNTPPQVSVSLPTGDIAADQTMRLEGSAQGKGVEVSAVEFRVDGGDWMGAIPGDGIFDSPHEAFALVLPTLSEGEHTLEIRVTDGAGNVTTKKETLKAKK